MRDDVLSYSGIDVALPGATRGSVLALTLPRFNDPTQHAPADGGAAEDAAMSGNPLLVWFGLAFLLLLLHLARQHSSHLQQRVFGITPFTIITVGIIAVLAITFLKFVFTKFPVPGVTALVLSV